MIPSNILNSKCECPDDSSNNPNPKSMYLEEEFIGMYHKPNKCECTNNLKQYLRNGKKIRLCSCCVQSIDVEVRQ